MLHRVNKLQFETICPTEARAFEVRHKFAGTFQEQIAEVIDKVCSQYVSEEEWIQIDRIEVNLENFSAEAFEKKFTRIFLEKFQKEFLKKIQSIPAAEKISSKQTSLLKLLLYFLQKGVLPWWAQEEEINISAVFKDVAGQERRTLLAFLEQRQATEAIWQRLSMQFDAEVQALVFSFFSQLAEAEKKLAQWILLFTKKTESAGTEAVQMLPPAFSIQKFVLMQAPVFFKAFTENAAGPYFTRPFAEEFTRLIPAPVSVEEAIEKISAYEKKSAEINQAETPAREENKKQAIRVQATNTTEEKQPGKITVEIAQARVPGTQENTKTEILKALEEMDEIQPEKFTVHTAGLVLLGPYFKQLFTHLDLLEQHEWKSKEAHYKAIHLVRYLATGWQGCPEYSLALEKLLCGMEMNAPIPMEIILREEETTEATELLKAVIANWVKLKNTSVAGLQETFLKREGILTKKESGWLLRVERKTADVLLDSIPWSYATLAFPWNKYMIFTEW